MPASRCRRAYDHRLCDLAREKGDPTLFCDFGVSRSTTATRNPTQEWTAQQLRNATIEAPKILLRDRDDKFRASFDRVAKLKKDGNRFSPSGAQAARRSIAR
jgi:tripartite-type tricarboxylate transporter receptor subunit TctC